MILKKCTKCYVEKELCFFHKGASRKDGFYPKCKECRNIQYRQDRERLKEKAKNRYYENKEKGIKPKVSPNKSLNDKKYYDKNRKQIIAYTTKYVTQRRRFSPAARLACNLRRRLNHILKDGYKAGSAVRDLGCSALELKRWIEQQFQPGMNWENYGDWHIDHIIPLSTADLTDIKEFKKVCHWFNLRPLWAAENISKGNKI
jgi:hypothetical protein